MSENVTCQRYLLGKNISLDRSRRVSSTSMLFNAVLYSSSGLLSVSGYRTSVAWYAAGRLSSNLTGTVLYKPALPTELA